MSDTETIEVPLSMFKALLRDSKHLKRLGYDIAAYAKPNCGDKYLALTDIILDHHNANCGPLHMAADKLLESR